MARAGSQLKLRAAFTFCLFVFLLPKAVEWINLNCGGGRSGHVASIAANRS